MRSKVFIEVHCEYRQDGPDEMKPVGEVEYIQTIADDSATGCAEQLVNQKRGGTYNLSSFDTPSQVTTP